MAVEPVQEAAGPSKPTSIQDATGRAVATNETTPLVMLEHGISTEPTSRGAERTIALEETKGMLVLCGPLIVADAVQAVPSLVIGILLGNVSSTDSATILAGSSLSSFFQVQTVYMLMGGVGSALQTLGVQSFGADQLAQLCLYAQAAILAYAYFMPVLMMLGLNGETLFKLFGQDPGIAHVAGMFMRIDTLSMPLMFAASTARCMLSSQRNVGPLAFVPVIAGAISLPLAYLLGYRTPLGYVGVELATVMSNAISAGILVPLAWKSRAVQEEWPGWQWREAHELLIRMVPLGVSSICLSAAMLIGMNVSSILCGYLPNAAVSIASNSIASGLFNLAIIPLMGICSSEGIRVGSALGANQPQRVVIAGAVGTAMTIASGALASIVCVGFARSFADVSTSDPLTAETGADVFYHIVLAAPLMGWMLATQGVLNACGKQGINAVVTLIFLVGVGSPAAYLLGASYGFGTAGVWYGQMVGIAACSVATTAYLLRLDWTRVAQQVYENTHIHTTKVSRAEV